MPIRCPECEDIVNFGIGMEPYLCPPCEVKKLRADLDFEKDAHEATHKAGRDVLERLTNVKADLADTRAEVSKAQAALKQISRAERSEARRANRMAGERDQFRADLAAAQEKIGQLLLDRDFQRKDRSALVNDLVAARAELEMVRKDAEEEAHGGCFWHHRALRAEAALAAAEEGPGDE